MTHLGHRTTPGHDDGPDLDAALAAVRDLHRSHCRGCSCVETVKVSTIENLYGVEGPDGDAVGVEVTASPMVTATYATSPNT